MLKHRSIAAVALLVPIADRLLVTQVSLGKYLQVVLLGSHLTQNRSFTRFFFPFALWWESLEFMSDRSMVGLVKDWLSLWPPDHWYLFTKTGCLQSHLVIVNQWLLFVRIWKRLVSQQKWYFAGSYLSLTSLSNLPSLRRHNQYFLLLFALFGCLACRYQILSCEELVFFLLLSSQVPLQRRDGSETIFELLQKVWNTVDRFWLKGNWLKVNQFLPFESHELQLLERVVAYLPNQLVLCQTRLVFRMTGRALLVTDWDWCKCEVIHGARRYCMLVMLKASEVSKSHRIWQTFFPFELLVYLILSDRARIHCQVVSPWHLITSSLKFLTLR